MESKRRQKKYLRVDEIADILDVNSRTVYRLLSEGELIAFKVRGSIRVLSTEIDRYVLRQIDVFQEENGIFNDRFDNR